MPDVFWPFFRDKHLAKFLPVLAAKTVEAWVRARFGLKIGVIAIPHTFNGKLEFNAHVHVMLTAGGLDTSRGWLPSIYYDVDALTHYWRKGVIRLLRARLRAGKLLTELPDEQVEQEFLRQENRWWSVKLQSLGSKEQFLRYAGRYARRPPIAQRRILGISKQEITFCAKDRRLRRQVIVRLTPKEFLAAWMQHVPERYEHRVCSFGMFAPRAFGNTSAAVFAILGQSPGVRPKPLPWRLSIKRDFGWDPLLDRQGNRMTWNRRIAPQRH